LLGNLREGLGTDWNAAVVADGGPLDVRADQPPITIPGLLAWETGQVAARLLPDVGARPRHPDAVDQRVLHDVQAKTGKRIATQAAVGGFPRPLPVSTILQYPSPISDGNGNGYTDLEEWLFQLEA
jgi:hypothetical protein